DPQGSFEINQEEDSAKTEFYNYAMCFAKPTCAHGGAELGLGANRPNNWGPKQHDCCKEMAHASKPYSVLPNRVVGDSTTLLTRHERNGIHNEVTQHVTEIDDGIGAWRRNRTTDGSGNPNEIEGVAQAAVTTGHDGETSEKVEATDGRIERRPTDLTDSTTNPRAPHLNVQRPAEMRTVRAEGWRMLVLRVDMARKIQQNLHRRGKRCLVLHLFCDRKRRKKAGDVCRTAVHQLSGHQERRRDEFTRMRLQLRIPAIERVFFTCEDSVQYFENGFHILKEVCQILYMEGPNPVSSAQGSTSENSGHGLPVLNKEGNLASLDTDEGGWVFDSSSSEVQMLHRVILYSLFLQGLETDSAIVKKIRQAIDNQTEVTVQLINYTKT
ncbi:hypothetical protein S245_060993, partial [Arachis hypogaea]